MAAAVPAAPPACPGLGKSAGAGGRSAGFEGKKMFREYFHRLWWYKKRVMYYTVQIEYLDGRWHAYVTGPAGNDPTKAICLLFCERMLDVDNHFKYARRKGLNFIESYVRKNS